MSVAAAWTSTTVTVSSTTSKLISELSSMLSNAKQMHFQNAVDI